MNKDKVLIFKALADETRLAILDELSKHTSMSCQELSTHFDLSQPALSHHFKKLCDANLIIATKDGTHMNYALNKLYLRELGVTL